MIFNLGQHPTGGYFLFVLHEPGLTKIFADPGQQFSTRCWLGQYSEQKTGAECILGAYIPYTIVACDFNCVV
jgi:hypothetical protein